MNCQQIQEYLPEYVDRQVRHAIAVEIDGHVTDCPECRDLLAIYRQSLDVLTSFPDVEPPHGMAEKIFRRTAGRRGFWTFLERYVPLPQPALVAAAAAVIIAVVSPLVLSLDTTPTRAANKYAHRAWSYSLRLYGKAEGVGQEIATFKKVFVLILDRKVDLIQEELESYSDKKQKNQQRSSQGGILAREGAGGRHGGTESHVLRES